MPQLCKICTHPDRQAMESLLLEGYPSLREIGTQYGASKDSLSRHWQAHMEHEDDPDKGTSDEQARQDESLSESEPRQAGENKGTEKKDIEAAPEPSDVEARQGAGNCGTEKKAAAGLGFMMAKPAERREWLDDDGKINWAVLLRNRDKMLTNANIFLNGSNVPKASNPFISDGSDDDKK